MDEFNHFVIKAGFNPEEITSEQKASLQAAWRNQIKVSEGMRDRYAGQPGEVGYDAVHDAYSRGGSELDLLRASRGGPPPIPRGGNRAGGGDELLEAGLCHGLMSGSATFAVVVATIACAFINDLAVA